MEIKTIRKGDKTLVYGLNKNGYMLQCLVSSLSAKVARKEFKNRFKKQINLCIH